MSQELDKIAARLDAISADLKRESQKDPLADKAQQVNDLAEQLQSTDDPERRRVLVGHLRAVYQPPVNATGQPLTSPRTEVPMPEAKNPQPTAKQEGVPVPGGPVPPVTPTTPATGQAVREQQAR